MISCVSSLQTSSKLLSAGFKLALSVIITGRGYVMYKTVRGKLERFFLNSRLLVWGLSQGSKEQTYAWLNKEGINLRPHNTTERAKQILLRSSGLKIEDIMTRIVEPRVKALFSEQKLNRLRQWWRQGYLPDSDDIKSLFQIAQPRLIFKSSSEDEEDEEAELNPGTSPDRGKKAYNVSYIYQPMFPFLEVRYWAKKHTQHIAWGEFAGIWFEEIEPALLSKLVSQPSVTSKPLFKKIVYPKNMQFTRNKY